jgi:hypothetical protein
VVVGGVEVGRIPFSQAQAGDTHLALFSNDTELGRIPLDQHRTAESFLVLRDSDANVGYKTW